MGITEERIKRITEQAAAMKAIGKASVDVSGELESLVFDNAAMKTEIRGLEEANARLRERLNRGENHDACMKLPLDADGEPIRIGDKMDIDGDAMTVLGYRLYNGTLLLIVKKGESNLTYTPKPSRIRHFKHVQPDSWEKLEEDANLGCRDYCEKHRLEECDYNMRVHMLDRAKKLAGIEDEAQR